MQVVSSDAPSAADSVDLSDAADDGQAVDSLASVWQQKNATLSAGACPVHIICCHIWTTYEVLA